MLSTWSVINVYGKSMTKSHTHKIHCIVCSVNCKPGSLKSKIQNINWNSWYWSNVRSIDRTRFNLTYRHWFSWCKKCLVLLTLATRVYTANNFHITYAVYDLWSLIYRILLSSWVRCIYRSSYRYIPIGKPTTVHQLHKTFIEEPARVLT